jgi:hypothetical protein
MEEGKGKMEKGLAWAPMQQVRHFFIFPLLSSLFHPAGRPV